ncbi:hypothetical protein [Flagellimonas sp. HSM57]|uniref:hypothetical protein n=1 Tax=Flagellimonas sp. HSM57 TaxID=2654675 RepID=UPI0013D1D1BE|nr:hypothetical protein [Flagellimonas sp. HSM57]
MKTNSKFIAILSSLFVFFGSCEPEAVVTEVTVNQGQGTEGPDEDLFKTEGFIVSAFASTTGGNATFAGYVDSKPVGNLDLTQFNSFSGYYPEIVYKNFAYGGPLDNENFELSRYAVDEESGQVIAAGTIPTTAQVSNIKILNDNMGVYTVFDTQKLFVFNPLTMEFIQEIDLSQAITFTEEDDQRNSYFQIIYRPQDNKVFLPLITDIPSTGPFYDQTNVYVEVIDMNAMAWESTAELADATYPITRGMENSVVDEQGNIYITCQGSYSLDGQAGPTAAPRSRPQILKIPAGSTDFDPSYRFNPVDFLGFNFVVAQFVTGTTYGASGIAYAAISAKADDARVLELLQLVGAGTATEAEFNELRNLVINGANSRWAKLDLNAQTAMVIEDIPFTAGFGYPFGYKYDDKMYFQTFNQEAGINGYYEYDPATDTSFNIFNITAGGIATQLVKLQE